MPRVEQWGREEGGSICLKYQWPVGFVVYQLKTTYNDILLFIASEVTLSFHYYNLWGWNVIWIMHFINPFENDNLSFVSINPWWCNRCFNEQRLCWKWIDNINIVKVINFSVSEYNQKNARSSSTRFIREEDQCGGKKTGGALDLLSYTPDAIWTCNSSLFSAVPGRTCSFGHLLLRDKIWKQIINFVNFRDFQFWSVTWWWTWPSHRNI